MKEVLKIYGCASIVLFLSLYSFAQEVTPAQVKMEQLLEIVELATGTGQTTGHVANVVLRNKSNETLTTSIGPFLIPGDGKHQGYLIPDSTTVKIEAGASSVVKLHGFCTNINLKPAPKDESLSAFQLWAIPDGTHSTTKDDWQIPNGFYLNVSQELGDFPYKLTYPGTNKTFIYSIEVDKHPKSAADLLLLCHDLLEEQYLLMEGLNTIQTPYSNNPERQKEALLQHTFWVYTSSLIGDVYTKDEFRSKMSEQFLTLVGEQKNDLLEKQFESGVDDFWSAFLKLANTAKIFKVAE